MKVLKNFSIVFIFLILLLSTSLFAENVKISNIVIQGNKKIASSNIISLLDLNGNFANSNDLNEYQKQIFKSNFFTSVDIFFDNKKIFIKLVENPIVDYIFIEGIESDTLLNEIKDVLNLKENNLFSESLLNSDIKKISNFLR